MGVFIMENIVKIGRVELLENEAAKFYQERKYICTSTAIFQIHYSEAQKAYYGHKVISQGIARRGRFHALRAQDINHILGKKILIED